jgi:hypothetical protein
MLSRRSYRVVWRVALIVGVLQGGYAAAFIARSSFVVEGQRYFCLCDDAMVSMRYAANWADGQGLVWNRGERVEGYTNFLWTAIMGLCHLLSLSPSHSCLLMQILGVLVLWGCLRGTVVLARACRLLPVSACCAVVLVGGFYNLILLTLAGMETGLLAGLVAHALAECVKVVRHRRGSIWAMIWFAPAALVRVDVLPLTLFAFVFLWLAARRGRLRIVAGLAVVVVVVLVHLVWRGYYYGEWLPNTFYLKLTGWPLAERLDPGFAQTLWTGATLGLPILLATAALLRPRRWHFLLLGIFAVSVLYQLGIGGDGAPSNRFVLPASLGLLVLAADGIHRATRALTRGKAPAIGAAVRTGLTAVALLAANAFHWDHWLLVSRPEGTSANQANLMYVRAVEKIAASDATVAVGWAGAFPYFSGRSCFDLLGKCDSHIARLPAHPEIQRSGHNKYDLAYTLTTYTPDILLHWTDTGEPEFRRQYRPLIVQVDGTDLVFCARRNDPKVVGGQPINWDTFQQIRERRGL